MRSKKLQLTIESESLHEKPIQRKKLIVQIPAYNEAENIGKVIKEIPRKTNDHEVIIIVIDDGSTDDTAEEAKKAGADFVFRNTKNSGLAFSFQRGLEEAVKLGADIIVNTDADFQYDQKEIPKLIQPILDKKADIVSGNRQVETLEHMQKMKKYGNILGSKVVRFCANNGITDASSGFRAYSREAAQKLFITSKHTYTHESLIQATHKNLKVMEIPVTFKKRNGDSKLIKSVPIHIKKSVATIARTTLMYNSLKAFSFIGILLMLIGLIPLVRWFWLSYVITDGGQHIQSLLLGSLIIIFGGFSILLGLISDIIAINRRHLEEILFRVRRLENEKNEYKEKE